MMKILNWLQQKAFKDEVKMTDSFNAVLRNSRGELKEVRDNSDSHEFSASYRSNTISEKTITKNKRRSLPKKKGELEVVNRFLGILNSQRGTSFVISPIQPPQDDVIDVIAQDVSLGESLNIQIRTSDDEPWRKLVKGEVVERSGNRFEIHHNAIKRGISAKSQKYTSVEKGGLILLLDGWLGVRHEDTEEYRNTEQETMKEAGFREIWFVGKDVVEQLYP